MTSEWFLFLSLCKLYSVNTNDKTRAQVLENQKFKAFEAPLAFFLRKFGSSGMNTSIFGLSWKEHGLLTLCSISFLL